MSDQKPAKYAEDTGEYASIQTSEPLGMLSLRADISSKKFAAVIKKFIGISVPDTRQIITEGTFAVAWMSPDELLLLLPKDKVGAVYTELSKALANSHYLLVDVSDAREVITISGIGAAEVLAKLTPADVSSRGLGLGVIRRSRLGQVPVAFWRSGDRAITLVCFRSVSEYVSGLLHNAADPNRRVGFV